MKIDPIGRPVAGWNRWLSTGWLCLALVCVWTFGWTLVHTHQFSMTPPERVVRGLAALGWSNEFYFWLGVVTISPLFVGCFLMGAAIFWLRPNDRMAVFTSIFLMSFGAANSFIPAKEYLELVGDLPLQIALPSFITGMLSFGLLGVFFAMYPDGQFVPGWMRWIALEGFLLSLAWNLFPATIGAFEGPLGIVTLLAVIIMFAGGLAAQVWRYRNYSTNLQKQQTKWFVYGLAVIVIASIVPSGILYAWNSNDLTDPRTSVLFDLFLSISNLTFGLLPVTIGVMVVVGRLIATVRRES